MWEIEGEQPLKCPWRAMPCPVGQDWSPKALDSLLLLSGVASTLPAGVTMVTRAHIPPCRSSTVVRSSRHSSQLWPSPMTPSTLTLSLRPAHPGVCP